MHPLIPLHSDGSLLPLKLASLRLLSTEVLLESLLPGRVGALKCRPDGTMLDGHHRISVLRERGIAVNELAREIIEKHQLDDSLKDGNNAGTVLPN